MATRLRDVEAALAETDDREPPPPLKPPSSTFYYWAVVVCVVAAIGIFSTKFPIMRSSNKFLGTFSSILFHGFTLKVPKY